MRIGRITIIGAVNAMSQVGTTAGVLVAVNRAVDTSRSVSFESTLVLIPTSAVGAQNAMTRAGSVLAVAITHSLLHLQIA